ncbi:MAG: TlpA family protein disulfide reductase [Vicingaceae bacterium]
MKKSTLIIVFALFIIACNSPQNKESITITAGNSTPEKTALKSATDFTLNDINGNPIALSSFKGKVLLVDFWASWCGPCRRESPNLVKAYNKYNIKGFDILSVSLDGVPQQQTPKQDWLNAIKADGLIWKNHVSDIKGWNSSVVSLYGLRSIPATLLIDKEGNIIAKNLRGKALEHKLASIFN